MTIEQELLEFLERRNVDWGVVAQVVESITSGDYAFIDERSKRLVEVEVKLWNPH